MQIPAVSIARYSFARDRLLPRGWPSASLSMWNTMLTCCPGEALANFVSSVGTVDGKVIEEVCKIGV